MTVQEIGTMDKRYQAAELCKRRLAGWVPLPKLSRSQSKFNGLKN